jgi:hypothetical protein
MPSKNLTALFGLAFLLVCCAGSVKAQEWIPKRVVGMDYPELASRARIEGKVEVVCMINSDGSVALTMESGNPILSEPARTNASKWLFTGKSQSDLLGKAILNYEFKLKGKPSRRPESQFVFEYPDKIEITSGYWNLDMEQSQSPKR